MHFFGKRLRTVIVAVSALFLLTTTVCNAQEHGQDATIVLQTNGATERPDFAPLLQALTDAIETNYVGTTPESKKLLYGAAKGLLRSLNDPHSAFFTPEETALMDADMKGSFAGIGVTFKMDRGIPVVVQVVPGGPAEKSGIKKDDILWKADGVSLQDLSSPEVAMHIRGPEGSAVAVEVIRKGESKPLSFTITRQKVSMKTDVSLSFSGDIAVITIPLFGENTHIQLAKAALDAKKHTNLKGVVVDLRDDGGGLLASCGAMLSLWLDKKEPFTIMRSKISDEKILTGDVLSMLLQAGRLSKEDIDALVAVEGIFRSMPTAVLMNGGSASASEIFAGALQDYGLAKVIGEKSYGKGSAQNVWHLKDGSSFKLTVQWWLTPLGRSIEKKGIDPDIAVERTQQDFEQKRDPQLDRALEYILQGK